MRACVRTFARMGRYFLSGFYDWSRDIQLLMFVPIVVIWILVR